MTEFILGSNVKISNNDRLELTDGTQTNENLNKFFMTPELF
jgi:hypothetical protein